MLYRKIKDHDVSALGFGCMRLPVIDNDPANIDESEAARMLHYAIDHGVNYVDTAWPYHMENSETFTGKALKDGYRDKVYIATKLPSWMVEKHEDCDKFLNAQLRKLQTDYIDFYLLHSLDKNRWATMLSQDVLKFVDRALRDGRIRYIGFSYHGQTEDFAPIIDAYPWTFCQIQYNYMDIDYQAGTKGLEYAASKGVSVIAMEPLRGGKLTKKVPPNILETFNKCCPDRTPADLALKWVWNHPEIATVLSGMSTMAQVEENVRLADSAVPNSLTSEESELISSLRDMYNARTKVDCTNCRYCLPCPEGVDIPAIFNIYNDLHVYEDKRWASIAYSMFIQDENKADKCVECGECEDKCPQGIPIIEELKNAHKALT